MAGELHHRGPDGVGLYLDERFGMSNTRLAIVDLEGGDQPLSNEGGRYWVMQNGEIYNYVELQEELRALGHRFATSSDTEVIAHAYDEWGVDSLSRLNGDFAFAVWDRREQELFLARDRFGVRPLFLAEFDGDLSFASEAKALFRHPSSRRALDSLGLVEAFTMWSILPDRSAFAGIRELPPAHYLRWGPGGLIEQRRWWDLQFSRVGDPAGGRPGGPPGGAHGAPDGRDAHPAARRRARRRLPERRARLVGDGGARQQALPRNPQLVRRGLQRPAVRRERVPGPVRPRARHEPHSGGRRLARHRGAPAARRRALREADTENGTHAAAAPVRRGPGRGAEGGDHGRGRRRALRRVRHLSREQGSALLGAGSRLDAPPAALRASERVPREGPETVRRLPRRLLQARARGRGRPALQPSAPLREHGAVAAPLRAGPPRPSRGRGRCVHPHRVPVAG